MRVLAAEDSMDLDHLGLPVERLEVVGDGQQVHLGRQLVSGVPPIGIGEDGQLPTVDDRLDLGLDVSEITWRGIGPRGDALLHCRSSGRVGLQRTDHVHPVQGMQMVEVHHVIVDVLLGDHQVADDVRRLRNLDIQRVLDGANGGDGMNQRTYTTGALGERPGVPRVATLQDDLDPPHHRAGRVRLGDDTLGIELRLDAQVALDSGDGINDKSFSHSALLFSEVYSGQYTILHISPLRRGSPGAGRTELTAVSRQPTIG